MRRWSTAAIAAAVLGILPATAVAGGGGCHSDSPTAGTGTRVSMRANCFGPSALWVEPDTTVRFINDDPVEHHVRGWPDRVASATLRPGMSYEFTFTASGIYPYACWIHPGMTGVVVVGAPAAPSGTEMLGSAGQSGEIRSAEETQALDQKPVASDRTDRGTVGGAAALAGAVLGTIGFVFGRRRRTEP